MNNFEPQYIILSSKYLDEKLELIKHKRRLKEDSKQTQSSKLKKIVQDLFK